MLKVSASEYLALGESLRAAEMLLVKSNDITTSPYGTPLLAAEEDDLRQALTDALTECVKLRMPVSVAILEPRIKFLPHTPGELNVIVEAIHAEIASHLFFFVPPDRAKYYDYHLDSTITVAFPSISSEMVEAGNAIVAGLFTASVFHAMRAVEIGVRAFGKQVGVSFPYDLNLAEWSNILDQIDVKIKEMKQLPRSTEKDELLRFYSEAAAEFRYFKDGWRVRVAHARATYDERQARALFDHTLGFFMTISDRIRE